MRKILRNIARANMRKMGMKHINRNFSAQWRQYC